MALSVEERRVREGCTAVYQATIKDESGNPVAASSLTTLTLTLYDLASGTMINSRSAQDVLNHNDVTINASGVLIWTMQPADNVIVSASLSAGAIERHVALFQWTWGTGGAKAGKYEVQIDVQNLAKVE